MDDHPGVGWDGNKLQISAGEALTHSYDIKSRRDRAYETPNTCHYPCIQTQALALLCRDRP